MVKRIRKAKRLRIGSSVIAPIGYGKWRKGRIIEERGKNLIVVKFKDGNVKTFGRRQVLK